MRLDLGCGLRPIEGHVGVDLPLDGSTPDEATPGQTCIDASGIVRFDLCSGVPWPFETESVDSLYSSHLIEHVPAEGITTYRWEDLESGHFLCPVRTLDALCWFMQEAWRVTKVGGEFLLRWPAMINEITGALSLGAFGDPTHRRFIPQRQIQNWSRKGREAIPAHHLGIDCNWEPKRDENGAQHTLQRVFGQGTSGEVIENEVLLVREP